MNQHLFDIIAEVLEVPSSEITLESNQNSLPDWDSLKHLNIIVELESAFEVSFDPEEIAELDSVQKISDSIQSKLNS